MDCQKLLYLSSSKTDIQKEIEKDADYCSMKSVLKYTAKHYFLIRVSNRTDSTEKQEEISQKGVYDEVIYDYSSGSSNKLTKNFSDLITRLNPGDSVTVSDVSRLTRNPILFLLLLEFANKREINFIFYFEGIETKRITPYDRKNLLHSITEAEFFSNKASYDMHAFYGRKSDDNQES